MTSTGPQSRFAFPYPNDSHSELCRRIVSLMSDGRRRSILEIQDALNTRKEIGARLRQLRHEGWDVSCSRSDGPDSDNVFRYVRRGKRCLP